MNKRLKHMLWVFLLVAALPTSALLGQAPTTAENAAAAPAAPPATRADNVKDLLHGVEMVDPYRWLEDQWSADTRAWIEAQNKYTDSVVNPLPGRDKLERMGAGVGPVVAQRFGRTLLELGGNNAMIVAPTGAVSSVDDVNTILLAGRADVALLARPHLVDPYWTLNAAIDQGYAGHRWPDQYLQGQTARRREQDPLARIVDQ